MSVRKVGTSGTNGVGGGIGRLATRVEVDEFRRHCRHIDIDERDGIKERRTIIFDC